MRLSAKLLSSLSKLNSRDNENKRRFLAYCRIEHANYDFYVVSFVQITVSPRYESARINNDNNKKNNKWWHQHSWDKAVCVPHSRIYYQVMLNKAVLRTNEWVRRRSSCANSNNRNNNDGKASLKRQKLPETTTGTQDVNNFYWFCV